jgi:N12 class adenine-specific DNA methylase/predicted RNA methylase
MSKKLSFCIKAVKTLDDDDLGTLTDAIEAYMKGGMATEAAERAAVDDILASVAQERAELTALLRQQHADQFDPKRERPLGSTDAFEGNKVFTADAVTAARARMRKKLGQTFGGFDPELMLDGITIAGAYIEAGARKFAELAALMTDEFGEGIKPYLLSFYEGVRHYPGFDAAGMDTSAEALEAHNAMVADMAQEQDDGQVDTGAAGAAALDEVAAPEGAGAQGAGGAAGGDPGSGVTSPASSERADRPRVSRARSLGGGATAVRAPAPRGRGKAGAVGAEGARAEGDGVPEQPVAPVSVSNLPAVNFRITPDLRLGQGGEAEKSKDNLAAIRVIKAAVADGNRRLTPDEQRRVARYVGWGGLKNFFPDPTTKEFKDGWKERGEELRNLLTPLEYERARRSTLDAHYTSQDVVSAMWSAARRLGFTGGLALESSMGTGNFLGLMPDALVGNTRFVGVEYDPLTSQIGQQLYPNETVLNAGFQEVPLPENVFDLAIGNPPFGDQSLTFQFKPELRGVSIHNQFIRAALDAVKPGGLSIQVVSRYLMDKVDPSDRIALARKAKLVGAVRLPDTAFKENARTEVVTDVLFFQKLTAEEQAEVEKLKDQELPSWTRVTKVKDPLGGEDITVNDHYRRQPDMVLGTLERSGTMAHGADVTVRANTDTTLAAQLEQAIARLPAGIAMRPNEAVQRSLERYQSLSDSLRIGASGQERGAIVLEDGKLVQVVERETPEGDHELTRRELTSTSPWSDTLLQDATGRWYTLEVATDADGKPVKAVGKDGKATKRNTFTRKFYEKESDISAGLLLGDTRRARLEDMVRLRDLFVRQINLETQDAGELAMETNRQALAKAYKAFTDRHGWVNDPANAALVANMPDGALILALETSYRPAITPAKAKALGEAVRGAIAAPAPILTRRVIPKYEPATKADSPADALAISLGETGRVDMARMASLLGTDEAGVVQALFEEPAAPLIFQDPETGAWEPASSYLSGNVRRKFIAAKSAGYAKNAAALERVQPEAWTAEQVTALLGSTWTPPQVYSDFFQHMTGTAPRITYSATTNAFSVIGARSSEAKNSEWGAEGMRVEEIIDALINTRPIRVYDRTEDGPRLNPEKTSLAQLKAKQIETEYADWVFADGERRRQLVDVFNEKFNTLVTRQYDGSHLVLPGKVPEAIIRMRRHQMNGIWRGVWEKAILYDHVVGAGKTFTAIARIMERRRMGLSKKPMIAVPNHLVEEWAAQAYRLYPGAKILAATKADFERSRRRKLFAKIASGDWDMVIVAHSSFGFIGIAPETEQRYLQQELDAAEQAVKDAEAAAAESGQAGFRKPFGVKEAERLRDRITARMERIKGGSKKDRLLTFEQMGIDDLTVDEAHEFKNLFYSSRLTDVKGMGNKTGSQKAFDLYNKVRLLQESPSGSIAFLTGTPISNSAVEMYSMMRYLIPEQLAELGLQHFDAWRAQYVSTDPGWEANETGRLQEVNRLGRTWSNMRSLMELYHSFTDSVSNDDIKKAYAEDHGGAEFPLPKVKGGDRQSIIIDPTPAQQSELERVIVGFDSLPNVTDPYERNIKRLRLMDRARKLSLDVRAASPGSASLETGGKLEVLSDNVKRLYDANAARKGTQIVFLDRSVPKSKGDDKILADYDRIIAEREAALQARDEEAYRAANDKLEAFNADEIVSLRAAQNGGWNAYQQIKDNLVARGIPANEIRFVQEASNDAQKQALFDAVNAGEVRVIIGSTPRMGAGTNIQKRLVALHHADVTWKPSDIEQREGRIIRQGNLFATPPAMSEGGKNELYDPAFEVEILAYATERTIDAKMWGLNSAKMRTINGIRKYDGAFTMEFEDAESVSMAEMAALASGDPMLLERVKLDSEINKLELLERQHRRKQWAVEGAIDTAKDRIQFLPAQIEAQRAMAGVKRAAEQRLAADVAARGVTVEGTRYTKAVDAIQAARTAKDAQQAGNKTAKYSITVNGNRYTSEDGFTNAIQDELGDHEPFLLVVDGETFRGRTAAGRYLAPRITDVAKGLPNGGSAAVPVDAAFAGLKLEVDVMADRGGGTFQVEFTVVDDEGRTVSSSQSTPKDDFQFTTALLHKPLRALDVSAEASDSNVQYMEQQLERTKAELPELESRRGGTFAQAEELEQKRARLEEVTRLLAAAPTRGQDQQEAAEQPTGMSAPMPNMSAADFQDTEVLALPETIEGTSTEEDERAVFLLQRAFNVKAPEAFANLELKALPRLMKPAPGSSPLAVERFAATDLLEKVYGKRIVWFSSNMQFANGVQSTSQPGAVFINEATTRPLMAVVGHELTHSLATEHPALYRKLSDRLRGMLDEPNRYHEALAAKYRSRNIPALSWDKLREELIADIVGDFHTDPVFWRDLARAQTSGMRRVFDLIKQFFDDLIRKLKRERPYGTEKYLTDLEAARAAVVEAMSAFANTKGATAAAADMAMASVDNDPFYSELYRHVARSAMGSGSADSWKQFLKSLHTKGVKADEIAWTGIEDWLTLQDGKISRDQVMGYLKSNGVQLTETMLQSSPDKKAANNEITELQEKLSAKGFSLDDHYGEPVLTHTATGTLYSFDGDEFAFVDEAGDPVRPEVNALAIRLGELREQAGPQTDEGPEAPIYGTYVQPGGENYRELLLKLPETFGAKKNADGYVPASAIVDAQFRSNHWRDHPNVLAHVRLTDRTDAEGKRVLFVEEIQSDWAQIGKKRGFLNDSTLITADEYNASLRAARSAVEAEDNLGFDTSARALAALAMHDDWADRWDVPAGPNRTVIEDYLRLRADYANQGGAAKPVPAGPFVTKTDAWVGLALKRVIKLAVDEGYDRVAIVSGQQAADNFDLTKHIKALRVVKAPTGYNITVLEHNGYSRHLIETYPAEALPDVVGKEMAQKIAEWGETAQDGANHAWSGLDLKVGGEGMRGFYDGIVPKVAKDVLRKLGGELTTVNIGTSESEPEMTGVDESGEAVFDNGRQVGDSPQLGFDITPAMREKAAGGLPMFSLPQYTPEQETALAKAGIDTRSRMRRARDKVRAFYPELQARLRSNWARQFRQGYLDQFTGIRVQPEFQGLLPDQDPYVAARLANGGTSSVMRALLLHGQAQWAANGQHLIKKPGTKGLLEIFEPLGPHLNDFFGWMVGNRAARLKTEGRENNLTDAEIQALRDLNKGREALFRTAALEYAAFKRSVLDIAEHAGLIDPDGRKVWDQADYIPFYREVDERAAFSPTGRKGLAGQSSGIRTLKGGTAALNDPMENVLMNFSRLVDASLKNSAIRKTVQSLANAGSDVVTKVGYDMSREIIPADQVRKRLEEFGTPDAVIQTIPPGALEGMARVWAIQAPTDPEVVRVMIGGKPAFYRVNDPLLLKALTSFVPFDFPGLGVARAFKRLLTRMVTITPEFIARNWIRDSASSQMIARKGFNPAKSITGIWKSLVESGGYEDMLFAGASFQAGHINAADPEGTARATRRMLRSRGLNASAANGFMSSIVDTPLKWWEKFNPGEAVENANREAIFEATRKAGGSVTAAVYESKDLMDFNLRGSSPMYQLLADVLPFFNARVQGLYRLGRANPKRLMVYGMFMLAASVALALENLDNPEYEELPDWDKDTYWHFWVGGKHFRLPKPFELGVIFATIPERIAAYIKGHDDGKKLAGRLWANIRDQLAFDPVPQIIRPAANVWANKDTFRDRPIESLGDERKLPSERYSGLTSPTARELVQALNVKIPNMDDRAMDALGLSPKKVEYLVSGYLGTTGLYALGLADMAVNAAMDAPVKPEPRLDDYPLLRTFYRESPARATVFESDLYEMRGQAAKVYASVMAKKKTAPDEAAAQVDENRALLQVRKLLESKAKTLSEINKMRDHILRSRDLTPKQKREALDQLQTQRNQLTRETMKAIKASKAKREAPIEE